jgi:hypothetical protein
LGLDLRYTEGLPMPLETMHIQAQHGHAQARSQAENTCETREEPHWIASFTGYLVYRQPISAQQQIRTVTLGLLQRGGAAPICHFRVVASDQNLRHLPATKIGRPRVMRKVQESPIRKS